VSGIRIDLDRLRDFDLGLDPQHPERSRVPARILGYGEISTVFEIQADGLRGVAFKRMPIFSSGDEMASYQTIYEEYNRLLGTEIGLRLPEYGSAAFKDVGYPIFYIMQSQFPYGSIAHRAMHGLQEAEVMALVRAVLRELRKVWDFNRRQQRIQVGLDGQMSNWAIEGLDPDRPHLSEPVRLFYLDTSTPLFRVDGVEQLNTELFLRSAPSFLVWVLRLLYVKDVVNRYYDLHKVALDLVANFFKEQCPQWVPGAIGVANDFFAGEGADLGVAPLSEKEVRSYYQEDAFIWSLYLAMRKVDRFLRVRVLRRTYPYILPEKVER
jgi:hypothetical protein